MSGSPIYLDDKLIGAYAYGWTFGSEPVAGVTPIRTMLDASAPEPSPRRPDRIRRRWGRTSQLLRGVTPQQPTLLAYWGHAG